MEEEKELVKTLQNLQRTLDEKDFFALTMAIYYVTGHQIIEPGGTFNLSLEGAELGYIKQAINDLTRLKVLYQNTMPVMEGEKHGVI